MRLNFKRLGLLCAKASRAFARAVDLTPARVDLMTVLFHGPRGQIETAAILCVSPPVVSRMVKALVELGLVVRCIPPWDRRRRMLALTDEGRARIEALFDEACDEPETLMGMQTNGEAAWMRCWREPLAALNLDTGVFHDFAAPFRAMQAWNWLDLFDLDARGYLAPPVRTSWLETVFAPKTRGAPRHRAA